MLLLPPSFTSQCLTLVLLLIVLLEQERFQRGMLNIGVVLELPRTLSSSPFSRRDAILQNNHGRDMLLRDSFAAWGKVSPSSKCPFILEAFESLFDPNCPNGWWVLLGCSQYHRVARDSQRAHVVLCPILSSYQINFGIFILV